MTQIPENLMLIDKDEYKRLKKDREILYALHSGGVDNWRGYYQSLQDAGINFEAEDDEE